MVGWCSAWADPTPKHPKAIDDRGCGIFVVHGATVSNQVEMGAIAQVSAAAIGRRRMRLPDAA